MTVAGSSHQCVRMRLAECFFQEVDGFLHERQCGGCVTGFRQPDGECKLRLEDRYVFGRKHRLLSCQSLSNQLDSRFKFARVDQGHAPRVFGECRFVVVFSIDFRAVLHVFFNQCIPRLQVAVGTIGKRQVVSDLQCCGVLFPQRVLAPPPGRLQEIHRLLMLTGNAITSP